MQLLALMAQVKSSMLNVINGVYLPQVGTVTYNGVTRRTINPRDAAIAGMARTFSKYSFIPRNDSIGKYYDGKKFIYEVNMA